MSDKYKYRFTFFIQGITAPKLVDIEAESEEEASEKLYNKASKGIMVFPVKDYNAKLPKKQGELWDESNTEKS